jgi:hypothetical protein
VFDFLVLYESVREAWRLYPFEFHAFVVEDEVEETLRRLEIDDLHVHRLPGEVTEWENTAALKVYAVEHSGLERCIVADADNVFVAETPELYFLLDSHDFVFVSGPHPGMQTHLWSFRRNSRTIEWARQWYDESIRTGWGDATGMPFALTKGQSGGVRVKILGGGKVDPRAQWSATPYNVQANYLPFDLQRDELGFFERQMGRAKVIHLSGLHGHGRESVEKRIDVMVRQYYAAAAFLPFYVKLVKRAAERLGVPSPANPGAYLHERLFDAGILPSRRELPALLQARGLTGKGVIVGSVSPDFSAEMESWSGELISTEQALEAEPRSLDFVYLELAVDEDGERRELERWYEKVALAGIFAGAWGRGAAQDPFRSKLAVNDFFAERDLRVNNTYADNDSGSWVVGNPESESERLAGNLAGLTHTVIEEVKPIRQLPEEAIWQRLKQLKALADEARASGVDPAEHLEELDQLNDRHHEMARAFFEPADWHDAIDVSIPPKLVVAVASPHSAGEENTQERVLRRRPILPFPVGDNGERAERDPGDDQDAAANVKLLQTQGADYLVFPQDRLWWLERYPGLKSHLEQSFEAVDAENGACLIFKLGESLSGG